MNLALLCFTIFFVRIIDTALSTVRTIILVKNKRLLATIIAFVEIIIWFLVVKKAFDAEEHTIFIAISYALGFAIGTYIGSIISEKLIEQFVNISVIVTKNKKKISKSLIENKFAFSTMNIKGKDDLKNKDMFYIVTNSKNLNQLKEIMLSFDCNAFIVVNETQRIINGSGN